MPLNNENNNDCCKCTTPEYTIELNAQGPQGRQGEQGLPGFSPKISVASNTYNQYTLNIQTEDGSITTPNLKASFPPGGSANDLLVKASSNDGDIGWANVNALTDIVNTTTSQDVGGVKYFSNNRGLLYSKDTMGTYGGIVPYLNPNGGTLQVGIGLEYGTNTNQTTGLYIQSSNSSYNPISYQIKDSLTPENNKSYIIMDSNNLKDYLVAGNNITLTPDDTGKITVASSGGTTGDYVTLDGDDVIGGYKTFSHAFTVGESTAANVSYGSQYIIPYNISEEHGFRIEPGGNDVGTKNLNIGRTNFTQWNTVNIAANNLTFNDKPLLTTDNISQNEYIKQLEQRIAALEALIDGGNANSVSTLIAQSSKAEAINSIENNGNIGIDNITIEDGE